MFAFLLFVVVIFIAMVPISILVEYWKRPEGEKGRLEDWFITRTCMSALLYLVISSVALVIWHLEASYLETKPEPTYYAWTVLTLSLIPIHLVLSIGKVEINQLPFLTLIGKPMDIKAGAGPVWVPFLISRLRYFPTEMQELELPAPRAKIWRGEVDLIPPGRVPAFRVPHPAVDLPSVLEKLLTYTEPQIDLLDIEAARNQAAEEDVPLRDTLFTRRYTSEIELFIKFKIRDAASFYRDFGDIETVIRLLEDEVLGVAFGNLSQITVGTALLLNDALNKQLLVECNRVLIDSRGSRNGPDFKDMSASEKVSAVRSLSIQIAEGRVRQISLDHTLNKQISASAAAGQKRVQTVTDSLGKQTETQLGGTAAAFAKLEMLTAEALGQEALAAVAKTPEGQFALAMDTAKTIAETAEHTVLLGQDGLAQLISATTAVSEAGKKLGKKSEGEGS